MQAKLRYGRNVEPLEYVGPLCVSGFAQRSPWLLLLMLASMWGEQ